MNKTFYYIFASFLLDSLVMRLCFANPAPFRTSLDTFEGTERGDNYYEPYAESLNSYPLSRLRRGYYYVDNGYITAVPDSAVPSSAAAAANRRQDNDVNSGAGRGTRYTPVVSIRQTRTKKHRKLFVPNLFG